MEGGGGSSPATTVEAPSTVKKRRGRPRKSETENQEQNGSPSTKVKRRRKAGSETFSPPLVTSSLVGQQVHGVLDGSFDAGYILTVRVGDSDTILRGVVFGPGLSVPITRANDIAPNVKYAGRDEHAAAQATGQLPPSRISSPLPHFVRSASTTPSRNVGAAPGSSSLAGSPILGSPALHGIQTPAAEQMTGRPLGFHLSNGSSSQGAV